MSTFTFTPSAQSADIVAQAKQQQKGSKAPDSTATATNGRPASPSHPQLHAPAISASQSGATVLPAHAIIDPLSSPDAEFEICGWLLRMTAQDLPLAERLFDRLSEKDVSYPLYRNIIQAAKHLVAREQVAGATAVLDFAAVNSLDVGGPEHIAQLVNDPIGQLADEERLQQDVDIVLDYAVRRKIRSLLQSHLNELDTKPVHEIVTALADSSSALQNDSKVIRSEPVHISDIMDTVVTNMFDETPASAPISTGYEEVDSKLNGGLRDQDLIILAGRPAMGKTAMGINGVARNVSLDTRHRRPVLVFSLEMSGVSLGSRILASEAGIPAKYFRSGDVSSPAFHQALEEVLPRFAPIDGTEECTNSRLWIDDTPGLTLADVRTRSRQFARKYGRPVIIVDYLQLLAGGEADARAVGTVSTGLKNLARELNTPIVALSQLNRSLESRTNKQPIMSDLRESGNIEQDADIIMFLYRDVVYNPDTPDPEEALVIVAKQREGENGPIPLRFNGALVRYESRGASSMRASDDRDYEDPTIL